jgi:hypothetical protein
LKKEGFRVRAEAKPYHGANYYFAWLMMQVFGQDEAAHTLVFCQD